MRQLNDAILLRGAMELVLRNAQTGEIIRREKDNNAVVTVGRAWMLNRLGSNDSNVISKIFIGTDTQTPATGLTALAESFSSKNAGTLSGAGTTANPPYFQFQVSWASNETHASSSNIEEFGLFNDNDVMVGYLTTSAAINFGSTNTLAVTYTLSN